MLGRLERRGGNGSVRHRRVSFLLRAMKMQNVQWVVESMRVEYLHPTVVDQTTAGRGTFNIRSRTPRLDAESHRGVDRGLSGGMGFGCSLECGCRSGRCYARR